MDGYSFTLIPTKDGTIAAATHLTACPFHQIVRLGNAYYGVADDQVYELTGDAFDGEPIIANVKTHGESFGVPNIKRARSLTIAGELAGDFMATVEAGELEEDALLEEAEELGYRNHRVKLPRDVSGSHLSYRFVNANGQRFRISALLPRNDVLRKTIGGTSAQSSGSSVGMDVGAGVGLEAGE